MCQRHPVQISRGGQESRSRKSLYAHRPAGEKLNLKTPAVSSFDIFDFRVQFFEDRESIHVCVEVDEVDNVEVSMFFWATTNTLTQPF